MPADSILDRVSVASPCSASWADMKGDHRVRFCGLCDRHVYNISALPAAEATALVTEAEGRLCIQFYRRRDGTILTADCPIGMAERARRRLFRMASFAVVGIAAVVSGADRVSAKIGVSIASGDGFSMREWYDWALIKLGFGPPPPTRGEMVMGKMVRPFTPGGETTSAEDY